MLVPVRNPHRVAVADRLSLGCAAYRITLRELGELARMPRNHLLLVALGAAPIAPWGERLARILGCDRGWLERGAGSAPSWATAAADDDSTSAGPDPRVNRT